MRIRTWLIAAAMAPISSTFGQTYDWNNANGGSFNTAANWTPAGPPNAATHIARFILNNTYSVTFGSNVTIQNQSVSAGDVAWQLNGWTFTTTATGSNNITSTAAPTSLRIANGTYNTGNLILNGGTYSSSLLLENTDLSVGTGVFYVAGSGLGVFTARDGSVVNVSSTNAHIGFNAGSIGAAVVSDVGTTLNTINALNVGHSGTGSLTVQNGAVATLGALNVGVINTGSGVLNLQANGSTLTVSGTTNLGGVSADRPAISAVLNVGVGAVANFNGTFNFRATGVINLNGGTINFNGATFATSAGAAVNFNAGTIRSNNGSFFDTPRLDLFLGPSHVLGSGRTLNATSGLTTLTTPLSVIGGSFAMNTLDLNASVYVGAFGSLQAADIMTLYPGNSLVVGDFGDVKANTILINTGGVIELDGPLATLSGQLGNSAGLLQGTGRIKKQMNNTVSGVIRLREGDHLIFEDNGHSNSASIELAGGTIEFSKVLNNLASGVISGRGVFKSYTSAPGTLTGLSNQGVVMLSAGYSDFYGDINNFNSGKIIVAGGATATFYDDITHNGSEIRTVSNARSVFFGAVSGAGPFTGSGTVEFQGDLKPGNSPATVSFAGNVEFGPSAALRAEIGGLSPGSEYDQLLINGSALLDGQLHISLVNGFEPAYRDQFNIVRAGTLGGTFGPVTGMQITPQKYIAPQYVGSNVFLTVTLPGDANFDFTVNFNDLLALARHYNGAPNEIWQTGDFTGDGAVTFNDLLLLAKNYNASVLTSSLEEALGSELASDWALAQGLVPEPALLVIGPGLCLLRRRRSASTQSDSDHVSRHSIESFPSSIFAGSQR